jgi:hypothetical protein
MERLARPLLIVLGALIPVAAAWAEPGTAQGNALRAEVERLRDYQARQRLGARLLEGISRSLPELLWLDRLNVASGQIVVEGRAFNTNAIANFITNLDKLPELDEPLLRSTSQEPDSTFKFTLLLRPRRLPAGNTSLQAERESLLHGLAAQSEMPEALQRLRALLEPPGIKVEKFAPLPQAGKGRREPVLPVEIRIGAESYVAVAALFDRLSRFLPMVALDRLNVARKDAEAGSLAVDFSLVIPVLKKRAGGPREAPESEAASPEKTAGPARQPFQVLALDKAARSRPEGLAGLLIAELELREIFRTSRGYVAQVWAREAKRLYLLKEGDHVFDGEVVRITPDETVLRRTQSTTGDLREVILSLDEIAKP